jgi:hypothetical protein
MCTVTWAYHDEGYRLLFNRDEKRTRKAALAPLLVEREGVRYVSPVDGDAGGTWIGTNEFGVSACLLNGGNLSGKTGPAFEAGPAGKAEHLESPLKSRGFVLPDVLTRPCLQEIRSFLRRTDLSSYAPFTLAALEPSQPAFVFEWSGSERIFEDRAGSHSIVTSSSFDSGAVRAGRLAQYRQVFGSAATVDPDSALAFHRSHTPSRSAYSVCMHRPDAVTVSFSTISVTRSSVVFDYFAQPPCCEDNAPVSVSLPRRSHSS